MKSTDEKIQEQIPEGSLDLLSQKAQRFLISEKKLPKHLGITLRVTNKQGRYYVTEWRTGQQAFAGKTSGTPIARISPIKGKQGMWQLAWMRSDLKWYNLGKDYQGTFDHCLELIVEDPAGCFWG